MGTRISSISSFKPAAPLPEREAFDLAALGQRRHVAKNSYLFQVGDPATHVFLVETGHVKLFQQSPGGTPVLVFFYGQRELFGVRAATLGDGKRARSCAALASEDSVISAIPVDRFLKFLSTQQNACFHVIRTLATRLDETTERLASFAAADIGARVARIVLHMSTCYGEHVGGSAVELGVPLTQQELANVVGAARQTVNGILQSLKAEGIISVTKQHMRVEDEERLRRIAMRDSEAQQD